ncbi:MAG: ribosomal RNA small subunit methyltransferase A [Acidobacteria bacterium]|nr:ribosomal RNA small subunit methyltransferase A [Acidobacteriota bacterium]
MGQNFLRDPNTIRRIVAWGRVQPGEPLLEIGPGKGALTRPLLQLSDNLIAVERDEELARRWLFELFAQFPRARLQIGDIRAFDPAAVPGFGKRKVFGNLPYSIATHLILKYAEPEWSFCFSEMIFMSQREVGERIWARPGSGEYGYLSCVCQLAYEVEKGFRVAPTAFSPRPKVDSIVFRLRPRAGRPCRDLFWTLIKRLLRQSFAHRRKMIQNNLRQSCFDPAALEEAGIAPTVRPEEVTVEKYVRLAQIYHAAGVS